MFKIRFFELDVRLSELQTARVSVASWEYPVLQAVWGEAVTFVNEVIIDRTRVPEAADEFRRLANRYKSAEPGDAPFVAAVYGQFGPGVAALAEAIQKGIFEGSITSSARPSSDVPAPGQVPDELTKSIPQLEKELALAKALQGDLAIAQNDGANNVPLSQPERELISRVAPNVAEAIAEVEATPPVVTDALLAGAGVGQAQAVPSAEGSKPFVLDESAIEDGDALTTDDIARSLI